MVTISILASCGDEVNKEEGASNELAQDARTNNSSQEDDTEVEEVVENSEDSETSFSLYDFDSFLGIDYGTNEKDLTTKIGEFTGGNYSADSTAFIYVYGEAERVPIQVWVDAETNKVITIFIEVLSLKEGFEEDLDAAQELYNFENKDMAWLGLTIPQIKSALGKPAEEAISDKGVTLLAFDSEDFSRSVSFKFYPEQDNICSSIVLNWFY